MAAVVALARELDVGVGILLHRLLGAGLEAGGQVDRRRLEEGRAGASCSEHRCRISTGSGGPRSPGAQKALQDVKTTRRAHAVVHAPCDGPPPVPIGGAGGHHGAPACGHGPGCDAP